MLLVYLILMFIIVVGLTLYVQSSENISLVDGIEHKNIILKQNSWHWRYYKLVISDKTPKSLCPYFWRMVALCLLSPIILPFIGVVKFIIFLRENFKSTNPRIKFEYNSQRALVVEKIFTIIGKILLTFCVLTGLFCVVMIFYEGINKVGWIIFLKYIGIVVGFIILILIITVSIFYIFYGFRVLCVKFYKSTFIQVFVRMIIGIYNRACPIIDWKEK